MCGFAGYVGERPPSEERISAALDVIKHRGPDDASHRSFTTRDGRHIVLLHRRLTIIDFDPRSNQPFQHGHTHLAFVGELYNYLEVRAELEREGVPFRTPSDTEVLCAALDRGGVEALDRCEGMWSFAAYDERTQELVLSRDRFGEKPLWLWRADGGLYWASEPKALFALAGRRAPVNLRQIQRYLVNGYKALHKTTDTWFEGVKRLEPGTVMRIGADGQWSERYWTLPERRESDMTFEEAVAGSRARLLRSMELRLRADAPLAFCMSGGIDSLSLISIAKRVFDYDVHGFTILNTDSRYEERDMVDHAVEQLGVRHTMIPLDSSGFLERLRTIVRHHDAPISTISYYVQWLLMQAVHDGGYRVSVSGTAADELFSGYYDHHLQYLFEVREEPALAGAARTAWMEHVQPIVRNPYLSNPDLFVEDPAFRGHIFLNRAEFAGYLHNSFAEDFTETRYTPGLMRNRMLNELFVEAVPVILHEDDLNAMAFSIENRSPFLDRDLFEFAFSIPTRHLIRDGKAKAVLREAMRGIVPDKILDNRRKVGFNAPILELLDPNDPAVKAELIGDSPLWDVVRRERVEELLGKASLPNSESKLLFYLVNAKAFLEELGS